jgi:small-conductance mechanosensitive channel
MTDSMPVENLIERLLQETTDVALMSQVATILVAFFLGWLASRQLLKRMQPDSIETWHAKEWPRFLIPLFAQLLVIAARPLLAEWHTVHLLNLAQPLLLSMFIIQLSFFLLRSIFQPGPALRSVERVVSWLVWGAVALHITGHLGELVDAMDAVGFTFGEQRISIYSAFMALLSIGVTIIAALSIGRLIEDRLILKSNFRPNIKVVMSKTIKTILLVIAVLIALPMAGIDITVLSVFGGALGVGLGFGLQKITSNYVSGFVLLLDNSIRIGDMVTVDGRFGEVREIATRFTVIRSRDGTEYILPNETLITSPVINHTLASNENRVGIPVQVAYGSDLAKVREVMLAAAANHPRVMQEPVSRVMLIGFGQSGIDMELRVWITDPEEGLTRLRSDINWTIWEAFQREGIEIPYPQRVVHLAPGALAKATAGQ